MSLPTILQTNSQRLFDRALERNFSGRAKTDRLIRFLFHRKLDEDPKKIFLEI